jgi:two-component system, NtrC family, sensor histidine kinase HydH
MQIMLDCRARAGVSISAMQQSRFQIALVVAGLVVTILLVWYAVSSYRSALPIAQTLQRGTALSLGQAIEGVASRDPSFATLAAFKTPDLAFFALVDRQGTIRFHSNPDLIGEQVEDQRYRPVFDQSGPVEHRVRLGTGEEVYELHLPLHLPSETLALRLALHSWQADQIIRRARTGFVLLLILTTAAWSLGLLSLRLVRRDAQRREALVRNEQLARLGELGAVLAHEVRTPLAGIKGFAQLLAERAAGDQRSRQCTDAILRETVRLEALVNDLLLYARPDGPPHGTVPIDTAVEEAWGLLGAEAMRLGVVFERTGERGLKVACSADRLGQLLRNLFTNAVQAMPQGGRLRVATVLQDDEVVMTVADSGAGFANELLPRVFDPFVTTKASGGGLGLAVCRRIAEGCGGDIVAENGLDGGALITVRLPQTAAEEQL